MKAEKLYSLLPISLQNVAVSAIGYKIRRQRYSKTFRSLVSQYEQSDRWSSEEIERYQREKLASYLVNCRDHVPYFKNSTLSSFQNISSENAVDVLHSMPVATKDLIRDHKELLVSSNTRRASLISTKTSGTTGKALSFYKDDHASVSQWAIWFRHRARFGIRFGDLHVNFTGKPIVPVQQTRPPYVRYNHAFRQFIVPMVHSTSDKIADIVQYLNSIKPKFYSGYPSIIAEVARQAMRQNLHLKESAKPKYIFPGAEPMLEEQQAILESWTGAVVSDQYGMTEGVCNISQCEAGRYHEDFELGWIEQDFLERVEDGGVRAKIIATGYDNKAFAFVRYDTGDVAVWEPEGTSCACGRSSRLVRRIEGRVEDYVVTPEGNRIMRFDYVFKDSPDLHEAQVLQFIEGEIVIRYVPLGEKVNLGIITEHVRKYISNRLSIKFERVDRIDRESNGKFRSVKSFLRGNQGAR